MVANGFFEGAVTLKPREVAASPTGEAETGTHRATKTPSVLRVTATKTGGEVTTRSQAQSDRDITKLCHNKCKSCFIKTNFDTYGCERNSIRDAERTNSRQSKQLPAQLEGSHSRPLGPEGNTRGGDRLLLPTPSDSETIPSLPFRGGDGPGKEGDRGNDEQRGSTEAPPKGSTEWLLLQHIPSPQKGRAYETSINLKALNQYVQPQHFKMEGMQNLRDLLRQNDWMTKLDLKDAYFTIPIHSNHRQHLRFSVEEQSFQFTCLPFGLSSAPWIFTKILKPVAALLREHGVRLIVYIDDMLIMSESIDLAKEHTAALTYLLENLGFLLSEKSVSKPAQEMDFLGMVVDSVAMRLKIPGGKIKKNRQEARGLLNPTAVSAREVSRIIGKMTAMSQGIPPAPLFYRCLQRDLSRALERGQQSYETACPLSHGVREELQWWITYLERWNGKSLLVHQPELTIESDASLRGWGAASRDVQTGGPWSPEEKQYHINCLEILAAFLAIKTFMKNRTDTTILILIDNTTAVAYINNLGGTVSPRATEIAKELWMWCLERNITVKAQYLPGVENVRADMESRIMPDRSDWMLNRQIFQRIQNRMGPVGIDLFASRLTFQLPRYFSWRPDPMALATDALLQEWEGLKAYANPPWNLVGRTLGKAQREKVELSEPAGPVSGLPQTNPTMGEYALLGTAESAIPEIIPQLAVWPISNRDTKLLLASWQSKSSKSYDSMFQKWIGWCKERNTDPISGPVSEVANFLADLYEKGYQQRSINAYRSAIASAHDRVDGVSVGQHPTVSRLMAGVANLRPPRPRYTSTWDVNKVLDYIKGKGKNEDLSLKDLTLKTVMLLALTRPSRSADLRSLHINLLRSSPEGIFFLPLGPAKQTKVGKMAQEYFFPKFEENKLLCPVEAVTSYIVKTTSLRIREGKPTNQLLIASHHPVTSSTIARWLKTMLEQAGIDTTLFKAHSTRGASVSAAALSGLTTNDILQAADWSSDSVFRKFYYKPIHDSAFGKAILSMEKR